MKTKFERRWKITLTEIFPFMSDFTGAKAVDPRISKEKHYVNSGR